MLLQFNFLVIALIIFIFSYCDNCINEELNNATSKFIKEIVHFQEKLYKRDPIKGCSKRRYIVGFHEVTKFLKVDKLKLVIIAPNINIYKEDGKFFIII